MVSMAIVEVMIDMAVEMFWPMEPRSGSDEHAAYEPLGAVVPIGGTIVRRLLIVSVRANRGRSDIDRNLRSGIMGDRQEKSCANGHNTQMLKYFHRLSFLAIKQRPNRCIFYTPQPTVCTSDSTFRQL